MSARRPGFWVRASPRRPVVASARFSSTSGTTSAIVASATRSAWRATAGCSGPRSAWASFATTPVPQRSGNGYSDGRVATIGHAGSSSPGRWWSETIMSTPSRRASSTSAAAVMPQSTVRMSCTPSAASRSIVDGGDAVALLEPAREMPARRRRRAPAASERRAPSRRSRRRRSRRGRRSSRRRRPRRGAARPRRPCHRAGAGRARCPRDRGRRAPPSGSPSPRRTSTVATVSETPSAAPSARTSANETGSTFQLATMRPR